MTSSFGTILDRMEDQLSRLDSDPFDDDEMFAAVDLPAVLDEAPTADELARAEMIIERLAGTQERTSGLQTRILGEIAGIRRPRRGVPHRSPRHVDLQG